MTQPQRHIVRRVVLEIENTATEAEQARLQVQIADICRHRLSAWLDRCCNQWSTPDQLKQIDRLEIDIPNVDLSDLDHVWTTQVEPRLEAALKKILQSTKQATQNKVQNIQEDLLRFFLQNGSLPWWADGQDKTLLQTAFHHLLKPESHKDAEQLRVFVLQNPVALQRLLYHFKDTILLVI